jgi:hypothetical protein
MSVLEQRPNICSRWPQTWHSAPSLTGARHCPSGWHRPRLNALDAVVLRLCYLSIMEHKGIRYSVVQTIGGAFKWTAKLATGERVGEARNRQMAILQAIKAIDKDQRQIKAALRKAERERKYHRSAARAVSAGLRSRALRAREARQDSVPLYPRVHWRPQWPSLKM